MRSASDCFDKIKFFRLNLIYSAKMESNNNRTYMYVKITVGNYSHFLSRKSDR